MIAPREGASYRWHAAVAVDERRLHEFSQQQHVLTHDRMYRAERALRAVVSVLSNTDGYFLRDEDFGGLVGEVFRALTESGINPNEFALCVQVDT